MGPRVYPSSKDGSSPGVKNGGAEDGRALFLRPWGHFGEVFVRSVFRCVFQSIVLAFGLPKWRHFGAKTSPGAKKAIFQKSRFSLRNN